MRFFGQWRLGVSLVAVAVTLNSGAALAQAGDGPDAAANVGGLDEIIVTARFREEALQETPLAITAISADDLEARSVANVQDLGRTVPNAFITPGAAATGATPLHRRSARPCRRD